MPVDHSRTISERAVVGVKEAARTLRERSRSGSEIAEDDQEGEEWREAFAAMGVDLGNALVAAGAFAACQILLAQVVQESLSPETALAFVTEHVVDAVLSFAGFVS